MAVDYVSFADDILTVLEELGNSIVIYVPDESVKTTTGKKVSTYNSYTGTAVQGRYDPEFVMKNQSVIKAGDVKIVVQFDDSSFSPVDKKGMYVDYQGTKYSIEDASPVKPNGIDVIVYILQARLLETKV